MTGLPVSTRATPPGGAWAWFVIKTLLEQLEEIKREHPYFIIQGLREACNRILYTPPDPRIDSVKASRVYPDKHDRGAFTVKVTVPGYTFRLKVAPPDRAIYLLYSACLTPEESEQRYEAELRAQEKLRQHISPDQWRQYVVTATLLETSAQSGFTYLFRRGFPTLVYKEEEGGVRFHIGLCFHLHGHEPYSWKGTLCPTDDVIAHLLLMRADEAKFWAKANHHSLDSGLLGI